MKRTYIIAEAGVNHNGSIEIAKDMIDVAKKAGADAVKFQSFVSSELATPEAEMAAYQAKNTGRSETQYEMLKKLELSAEDHRTLFHYCQDRAIQFLSTPFDSISLALLVDQLDIPLIKISSGDLTNAPFLLEIARTQKSVILSTGMSTLEEVKNAVSVLAFGYLHRDRVPQLEAFTGLYKIDEAKAILADKVTLLHCTSEYPAPCESVNLRAMDELKNTFQLPVGYSDHTRGIEIAIAAVARGAEVIEKHFTLDRSMTGPDHLASLEPDELNLMVSSIRNVETALGSGIKIPTEVEQKTRDVARKSLVAVEEIQKGEKLTVKNIGIKRPGNGRSPLQYWDMLGTFAEKSYKKDELL